MRHQAIAVNGPLKGHLDLMVERRVDGTWQPEVEWNAPGGRVRYHFTGKVALVNGVGQPEYEQSDTTP
jgi:hypothetical protein